MTGYPQMTDQEENHDEIKQLLQEMKEKLDSMDKKVDSMEKKVDPMYELFTNAKGFDNISKWIMVNLVKLAATVGVLYGAYKWFKN